MKLKVRFTPVGWLLAGFAALVLAVAVVGFVVNSVNATRISANRAVDDAYVWDGQGTLVLENTEDTRRPTCTIRPETGEAKAVRMDRKKGSGFTRTNRYKEFEPWFTGPASVTCTGGGAVNAWSGSTASFHNLVESGPLRIVAVLLAAIPLGIALLRFRLPRVPSSDA